MQTVITPQQMMALLTNQFADLLTLDGQNWYTLWSTQFEPALAKFNSTVEAFAGFFGYASDADFERVVQVKGSRWQKHKQMTKGLGKTSAGFYDLRMSYERFHHTLGNTREAIGTLSSAVHIEQFNAMLLALRQMRWENMTETLLTAGGKVVYDPDTQEAIQHNGLLDGIGNRPIPPNGTETFASTHNHYMFVDTLNAAWTGLPARDTVLRNFVGNLTEHGYRNMVLIIGNPQGKLMSGLQASSRYTPLKDTSPLAFSSLLALAGQTPQMSLNAYKPFANPALGLRIVGSYDNALVVETEILGRNHLFCFSHQGENSPTNPLQWRQGQVTTRTDAGAWNFIDTTAYADFASNVRNPVNGVVLYGADNATSYVSPVPPTVSAVIGEQELAPNND